ncbi:glycine cleavage T C-terminal barrel domain-containing protein [Arthrobacter sp. Cr_A7]|uniref:glycine cleavage T C-terminal barrel domain-containing protein n=1 Tax=Arthrobacter sp. Cr_A7 TaxID=3031017 RepID=UPI0023DA35B4|nr:glycine cleavage T C-terminal barrel domain-containing protein [Arthrobacter sp. Cr_A7]MDF2050482.1 glycine cleavage T C-terminal barrel domain-containing protein [Arthrobacter sp. Cr_A7]
MTELNIEAHRAAWKATTEGKALYVERPAVFSPAAAAQDASNGSRMLWNWAPIWLPWEYTSWLEEGRSFHDTAYIGDWSGLVKVKIKGPQAFEFLSYVGTNDLSNFGVGRVKHHVQVNENGMIAAQGVLYRVAEDEFWFTGGSAYWTYYMLEEGGWDAKAEVDSADYFLFSVQGPQSLAIMEAVTGSKLGHLRFNQWETFQIAGADVMVLRTGVSGEIGYELHGPSAAGNSVWSTVVEVGTPFGIKQLGVRAQMISHVEAGIATNDRDFVSAAVGTAGQPQINPSARSRISGSFRPKEVSDLHRTPAELGWFSQVSLDTHDFIGREALIKQRDEGGPARRMIGLVWNNQDVVDVYATIFDDEPVAPMDLPRNLTLSVDHVLQDGKEVGVSTSRVYSPFLRKMISIGHIDVGLAEVGRELTVLWGEPNKPQRQIRATVIELPFKPDLRRVELAAQGATAQ